MGSVWWSADKVFGGAPNGVPPRSMFVASWEDHVAERWPFAEKAECGAGGLLHGGDIARFYHLLGQTGSGGLCKPRRAFCTPGGSAKVKRWHTDTAGWGAGHRREDLIGAGELPWRKEAFQEGGHASQDIRHPSFFW